MKVSIPVVGNSIWSRLISVFLYMVSLCGIGLILAGVIGTVDAVLEGESINMFDISAVLVLIVMGLVIAVTPYVIYFAIARYVNYLLIKREVKKRGLEPIVSTSVVVALQLYIKQPGRPLLRYIQTLNPTAVGLIIRENPYAMETCSQMIKRVAGGWIAKIKKKHNAEEER